MKLLEDRGTYFRLLMKRKNVADIGIEKRLFILHKCIDCAQMSICPVF